MSRSLFTKTETFQNETLAKCRNNLIIFLWHLKFQVREFCCIFISFPSLPFRNIHVKLYFKWNCRRHFAKTRFLSIYYVTRRFFPSSLARRFSALVIGNFRKFSLHFPFSRKKHRSITSVEIFFFICVY